MSAEDGMGGGATVAYVRVSEQDGEMVDGVRRRKEERSGFAMVSDRIV